MNWNKPLTESVYLNDDCMKHLPEFPDNYFDLAIVDPPYGIGVGKMGLGKGDGLYRQKEKDYKMGGWDNAAPTTDYFNQLRRVSENQIIWGGNYFNLPPTPCLIFWDKNNGGSDFADGEIAWTTFESPMRKFKFTWSGFIQGKMGKAKETRIHPTQKPKALYRWLMQNYWQEGQTILDTHVGSANSLAVFEEFGAKYVGFELDADYYRDSLKNIAKHKAHFKARDDEEIKLAGGQKSIFDEL